MSTLKCPIESLGPGLTQKQIAEAEAALGQEIPQAYKSLLRSTNGCSPINGIFFRAPSAEHPRGSRKGVDYLMGVGLPVRSQDLVAWHREYGYRLPPHSFQFASDAGGNGYLVFTAGPRRGEVVFRDHESDELITLAPSMDSFLQQIVPRDAPEVVAVFPLPQGVAAVKVTGEAAKKFVAKKRGSKTAATKKPAAKKPAAKPAAKKAVATPAAPKTATKKTAAKKGSKKG